MMSIEVETSLRVRTAAAPKQPHAAPWSMNTATEWPITDLEDNIAAAMQETRSSPGDAYELGNRLLRHHASYCEAEDIREFSLTHYTSLKDLISASSLKRGSSTPEVNHEEAPLVWFDISKASFKNKLLNEAARAYLLPVAAQRSRKTCLLRRYWFTFTCHNLTTNMKIRLHDHLDAWLGFFRGNHIVKAFRSVGRIFKNMMRLGIEKPNPQYTQ